MVGDALRERKEGGDDVLEGGDEAGTGFRRDRGRSGQRPLDARLRKHEAEETNGSSLLGRQRQSREGEGDAWRGGGGRRQRREMGDRAQGKNEMSERKGSMGRGRGDRAGLSGGWVETIERERAMREC